MTKTANTANLKAEKKQGEKKCMDIRSLPPPFSPQNTCVNTHHELDVVKSIGQQVVLILDQANGVKPLAHGLQRAAGTYEGVEGQTLQ